MTITKPFLKWVGGKTQILDTVLSKFPTEIQNYYEPFVGGGSVLLGVLSLRKQGKLKISGEIHASDVNANLIALYKNIQQNPDAVIREVKSLCEEFRKCKELGKDEKANRKAKTLEEASSSPESYYFWIRSRFNAFTKEERETPIASAMLLFMNKTCFRGVYREGPKGFNVPFGNYKNPAILEEEHIRAVSELFQGVKFTVCSFQDIIPEKPIAGDFVYMDPPYAPETDTSFVGYTADGFDLTLHTTLFQACKDMREKCVHWLMSNAAVKLVKDAFPEPTYTTQIISCRRAINSKKPDAKTDEVLISPIS